MKTFKYYAEKFFVYFFAGISVVIVVLGIGRAKDNTPLASAAENSTGDSKKGSGGIGGLFAVRGQSISIDGAPYATPWGDAVASVTFTDGKITAISMSKVPNSPPSLEARPYLVEQALTAGNANIQGVSGATYASNAFKASLESAIAKARAQGAASATAQTSIDQSAGTGATPSSQTKPSVSRAHDNDDNDDHDGDREYRRSHDDEDEDDEWDD